MCGIGGGERARASAPILALSRCHLPGQPKLQGLLEAVSCAAARCCIGATLGRTCPGPNSVPKRHTASTQRELRLRATPGVNAARPPRMGERRPPCTPPPANDPDLATSGLGGGGQGGGAPRFCTRACRHRPSRRPNSPADSSVRGRGRPKCWHKGSRMGRPTPTWPHSPRAPPRTAPHLARGIATVGLAKPRDCASHPPTLGAGT